MTHRLIIPIFAVLFTAAVSFGLNTFAATFAEPSGTPPANNAAAPLDTSANANTKAGPLTVNSGIVTGTAGPTYGLLVQSGKVGIGTLTPTQPLEVAGKIKSSSGGFVFPDGTTQTTAYVAGTGPTYGFGGAWQFWRSCITPNPYTGGCSCPSGYGTIEVYANLISGARLDSYVCYKQ